MPGPVFIHCQTFSRKGNDARQSVAQVVAEVLRDPEFSLHVADPCPPRVLTGDPRTFMAEHDAHVAARATQVRTKQGLKARTIRADRHTLATIIASYPLTHAQIAAGGDEALAHQAEWEARTAAWVRARYGDQLRVVVAHDDENHPHLHFWLLPDDPDADATKLHPGKLVKRQVEADLKAQGIEPRVAVKAGNEALKVEMRAWVDDYHADVGVPLGMTRDGPKRRRLTRAQWQVEMADAKQKAMIIRRAENASQVVAEADAMASETMASAKEQAKAMVSEAMTQAETMASASANQKTLLDEREDALVARESAVLDREVKAKKERQDLTQLTRAVLAMGDQVESALTAVLQLVPRVRKILVNAQASIAERQAAREARIGIVAVVPTLRHTKSFLGELRRAELDLASASTKKLCEEAGLGCDLLDEGPS